MHMKFFVDTADTAEIKSLAASGLLDGVTTNPSLVAKTGKKSPDIIRDICAVVPGPVSAEVAAMDYDGMMREAFPLREIAKNEVLVASVVVEATKQGAHVVTLPPPVLRSLFNHPLTDKGLAAFLADWGKTGQTIS
jgi:transaldolase